VFADGRLVPELTRMDGLPPGVRAGGLDEALASRPDAVEAAIAGTRAAELGPFHALHDALFEDAAIVTIDDGVELDRPLAVLHVARGGRAVACHPTTVLVLGRSARATVVEGFAGAGPGPYLVNAVTDVTLADDARLAHYRLQCEDPAGFHVSRVVSRQGRDSRYHAVSLDFGARLARHDVIGVVDGEGAVCRLDGLVLTDGDRHVDNHTVLEHARPHGDSRELYKCILAGRSRSVFHGRIVVRRGAQKTDAKQSNPNLLLSPQALAHTRPQLEIYADDVKCTHGATIGRLDEDAVFYLRSRGVGAEAARDLLVSAFAGEVLDRIEVPELRAWAEAEIGRRLGRAGA